MEKELSNCVTRQIEDTRLLIINSGKDIRLRKELDSEFSKLLARQYTISGGKTDKENLQPLLVELSKFRNYIIKRLSNSPVIRNPAVTLPRLSNERFQMSLNRLRFCSLENNGENNGTESSSDSDDDLFTVVKSTKNISNSNGENLPDKRIRKQVVRPDFINTALRRIKIKMDKEKEKDEASSSNDGGSPTPSSNDNGNGHHGGSHGEFPCPVCKKIFRKKGHMTRHLLTHEPEKPFGCDFCSKRFAAKYSLQMHLLNRHNTDAKPFDCTHCDKRFTLKKELDQHMTSHKEGFKPRSYPCHLCELKFMSKDDLDTHLEIHPEANIYHCSHCEKSFPRKYNLTRHERTHNTEKPYHCAVCVKDFGTKNGLHMHLQNHETDENKPLSCHLCGKKFTVEQNLVLHISYHNQSDEKPYPCELCEVRFKTQERLEKHFETHGSSEGRIYPCQYCEKTFPRKYNLVRHELSHTHGRRKPKDGMPTRLHDDRMCDDDGTDDESVIATGYSMEDENSMHDTDSMQGNSTYGFAVTKSELFTTFFGVGDGFFTDEDGNPPFSSEHYSIVKFENY